jgi:citrate lyase subunit beta/citryl-CoA lyase
MMSHFVQSQKLALLLEPEDINDILSLPKKDVNNFILRTDSDRIARYSDYSALIHACVSLRQQREESNIFLSCRINADALKEKYLAYFLELGVTGIFLENCTGGSTLQQLDAILAVAEAQCGLIENDTWIIAQASVTPESIFTLAEYTSAPARLIAIAFDEGILSKTMGWRDCENRENIAVARALVIFAAAAANKPALLAFQQNEQTTPAHYLRARQEGYKGIITSKMNDIDAIKVIFDTP